MRTFLVCTLSVTISPWKSLPTFLKEPMFAMSLLLAASCRDHRGLDGDREAGGDRRRTSCRPQRRGGWRRGDFVVFARNGRSPGEESRPAAIAAQAIEAKPSAGQITP